MAVLSFSTIYNSVRSKLNDTEVAGGRIYTDFFQSPFLYEAYSKLFGEFRRHGVPGGQRTVYVYLPPYTSYVAPVVWNIPNFGEPVAVWSRQVGGVSSIPLSPAPVYDTATGFLILYPTDSTFISSGNTVEIIGERRCTGDVNDAWTVSTQINGGIVLNGCKSAIISPQPAGIFPGCVVKGGQEWIQVEPITEWMNLSPTVTVPSIDAYHYEGGIIRVPPCRAPQELKITFRLSGTIDFTDPDAALGVDDAGPFLINYVASQCADSKGAPKKADRYAQVAKDLLDTLLTAKVKGLQANLYESAWLKEFVNVDPNSPRGRRYYNVGAVGSPAQSAGSGSGGSGVAHREIPAGNIDGTNVTFTIVSSNFSIMILCWNGVVMEPGVGYTISGTTITMASPPQPGDTLEAYLVP